MGTYIVVKELANVSTGLPFGQLFCCRAAAAGNALHHPFANTMYLTFKKKPAKLNNAVFIF